ncbi:MAG: hypothetical protein P8M11_11195 [Planctomycetota bacterium]|nr:hypothetical protein [Planctomycetota bacterium]MDG1985127.1 hypothetical protein [Planctomycetota bacterium]
MTSGLQLQVTDAALLWGSVGLMLASAALGLRAWRRSGGRPSVLVVEVIRTALIALILFALLGPEWVTSEAPEERPMVALLWDDSRSMSTVDVEAGGGLVSRSEALGVALAALGAAESAGDAATADGRFDLVVTALSATADPGAEEGSLEERGTDFSAPLDALLEDPSLRAVLLASDGDWTEGESPFDAAVRYRLADVPIFTSVWGSQDQQPDVALEPVEPPAFAIAGRRLEIPVSIESAMPREVPARISLSGPDGEIESRGLALPARRITTETLEYLPMEPGRVSLTIQVDPVPGELDVENNTRTIELDVREESLDVLLVESFPRWEYRYLRNALVRDPGVEVDCYLSLPGLPEVGGGPHYLDAFPSKEALGEYDVIFVGDVGLGADGLTLEQCEHIAGVVRDQAGGLILMPGFGGGHLELQASALGEIYPVDLDPARPRGFGVAAPSRLRLTSAGLNSSLTRLIPDANANTYLWSELPGFQWFAAVDRARAGAQVLAVHPESVGSTGRRQLLVTRTARTGKVLFMGTDGAWRWRQGFEDLYHYRFWGQVIRWMAYQRNMNVGESMRLFFAPDRPKARTTVALNANVMDAAGGGPIDGATVAARIQAPSGKVERVRFTQPARAEGEGAWGLYSASYQPAEGGRHQVTLTCEETGATLEAEISVTARPRERVGRPARPDVLAEVARISGGDALVELSAESLGERLAALPAPAPLVTRERLWGHPLFGALAALLMAALWIGRKAAGRV